MKEQVSSRPPFGIGTKRFLGIGFHPSLDPTGSMRTDRIKLGPGEYFPAQFPTFCKYKNKGSMWDRSNKSQSFSQNLGYRNAHILQERIFYKSLGGPGSYDVSEEQFHKKTSNNAKDVDFGKEKRFRSYIKFDQPPPDSYFLNILEKGVEPHNKTFNNLPTLEWDGFAERFKDTSKKWSLAPNRYTVKDFGDMDAIKTKIVSKRGPYDLFTGPRDNTTIKNHFSLPKQIREDKFYTWPSDLDYVLHNPQKRRYARFLKCTRFPKIPTSRLMLNDLSMCYKNPNDPSPAHYNVKIGGIRRLSSNKYPFDDSKLEVREPLRWDNCPGPGRYYVTNYNCSKRKNLSWVFKSKTPRTTH